MKRYFTLNALLLLLAFVALEILFVAFVDKPLAMATHDLDKTNPAIIDFFRRITVLGLGQWYQWPSGIGILVCLGLYYIPPLSDKTRDAILRAAQSMTFFFTCTACAGLFTVVLKPIFGRARPKLLFSEDAFIFNPMTMQSDWNSMPSGHTTTAFAVAASLMVLFPRARIPLLAFAVLIALSRIMVNAHYLSDVFFGAAVGWIITQGLRPWFEQKGLLGPLRPQTNP